MTKAAALLRVSTAKQVKRSRDPEETLPVQRETVARFAARRGWEIVRFFSEEGVSAWKNVSAERRVLQEVLAEARTGAFEVLLIFKYDRLSRLSLEYPMLLAQLRKLGVSVWSVADEESGRELAIDGQMDKLLRFLEGWQAETESYNTSVRVKAAMRRMAERGEWTGGRPPYGFRLANGGKKRGSPVSLEVDPEEAEVVRRIFRMYVEEGLGSTLIAAQLNREGVPNRSGKPWLDSTVRDILHNPMSCGRPSFGKTFRNPATGKPNRRSWYDPAVLIADKPGPGWEIVPYKTWRKAQEMLKANHRTPDLALRHSRAFSGRLLLTGLLRCGHCGTAITAGYSMPKYRRRDGTVVQYRYPRYVCRARLSGLKCDGQFSYSPKKLEGAVLEALRSVLEGAASERIYAEVRARVEQSAWSRKAQVALAERRHEKAKRLYEEWVARLNRYLADPGASLYSEAFLAERVREAERELGEARKRVEAARAEAARDEERLERLEEFLRLAPSWWKHFLAADRPAQKALLRQVLRKIVVVREGIELHWRIRLGDEAQPALELEWTAQAGWRGAG